MSKSSFSAIAVGALLAGVQSPAMAENPPTVEELQQRINELQATVDNLKSELGDNWLTEQRAEEIKMLVQDVLADADTRASLLNSGLTAGWDKKFFLESADGNFRLNFEGQLQVRFVYNHRNDSFDDNDRWGFENRRTKLKFNGHVVDPSWEYAITGAFDRGLGGDFRLEDAFINKELSDEWGLKFGQFKPPFMREELVSSSRQLLVDRSLVNEEFNQDFSQGVELAFKTDNFQIKAMYGDGFGMDNTAALAYDTEWAFSGRAEFLLAGEWGQFKDFTSWNGEEFALMVGLAGAYERDEHGDSFLFPLLNEDEFYSLTADISAEFGGANLFVAGVYRHLENADLDQWGVVVQGGFFVVDNEWEIYARYEYGDSDIPFQSDLSTMTVGFNRYWAKHGLKWTTDFGYGFNPVSATWASSGAGWLTDAPGEDGQIVIRSQFQLLF